MSPRAEIAWEDAADHRAAILQLDGLVYLEEVVAGRMPLDPMLATLGVRVAAAQRGRVVCVATPGPEHLNMGGIVHGGFLSALMDGALGFALHSEVPAGRLVPHVQASYRFLKAGLAGEELTVVAEVLRAGRTVGHVRCEVRGPDGKLRATGESTHSLIGG